MNDVHVPAAQPAGPSVASQRRPTKPEVQPGPFVPVLLIGLAVLAWTVFQTFELAKDRHALVGARLAQQPQVQQSLRLRASLSALASDTQKAADAGDADARLIVKQLRQHGITIHPNAPAPIGP